jgi:hypothetical protein
VPSENKIAFDAPGRHGILGRPAVPAVRFGYCGVFLAGKWLRFAALDSMGGEANLFVRRRR